MQVSLKRQEALDVIRLIGPALVLIDEEILDETAIENNARAELLRDRKASLRSAMDKLHRGAYP